ncbi:MAG: hypothetical protein WCG10_00610 [Chlamydiota bacterium]
MKKLLTYFLIIGMLFCIPSYADGGYDNQDSYDQQLGICASDGLYAGVGASMMGWGIAIIVGITILALVLHQSTGGTAHSPVTTTGGTSGGNTSTGIGAVI